MLATTPPSSYTPYQDYGRIYSPKATSTALFYSGKSRSERYAPVVTATRYNPQQVIEQNLLEDLVSALEDWYNMYREYLVDLKSQVYNDNTQGEGRVPILKELLGESLHLRKVFDTSIQSLRQTLIFIANIAPHLRPDFLPSVAIDNEGEFSFEWYGRRGARASVIIGAKGVLYFVSLFHGETHKSRLLWNNAISPIILTELDKIYKDKQV